MEKSIYQHYERKHDKQFGKHAQSHPPLVQGKISYSYLLMKSFFPYHTENDKARQFQFLPLRGLFFIRRFPEISVTVKRNKEIAFICNG